MTASVTSARLAQALDQLCRPVSRRDYPRPPETMRRLLRALGEPQRSLPAVTVTGSSGKSSVCHQLAAILQARGLRVGCYIGPHLHSFRERFLLDGTMISAEDFCAGARVVAEAAGRIEGTVSTIERSTALALWWFQRRGAQLLVLETGLGGRFDAVNAVDNCLALFTGIEAEHLAMLGGSLARVAWHKAGILRAGGRAISVRQQPAVRAILEAESARLGAELCFTDDNLAARAVPGLVECGLAPDAPPATVPPAAVLPGRLEPVSLPGTPPLLIDGGHTTAAARYLRAAIAQRLQPAEAGGVRLIAGFLADKDADAWLRVFDDARFHITLTRAPGHRAAAPQQLMARARLQRAHLALEPDLARALRAARHTDAQLVVVSGSLRLAARARVLLGLLTPAQLAEAQLTERIFSGADYLARLPD